MRPEPPAALCCGERCIPGPAPGVSSTVLSQNLESEGEGGARAGISISIPRRWFGFTTPLNGSGAPDSSAPRRPPRNDDGENDDEGDEKGSDRRHARSSGEGDEHESKRAAAKGFLTFCTLMRKRKREANPELVFRNSQTFLKLRQARRIGAPECLLLYA